MPWVKYLLVILDSSFPAPSPSNPSTVLSVLPLRCIPSLFIVPHSHHLWREWLYLLCHEVPALLQSSLCVVSRGIFGEKSDVKPLLQFSSDAQFSSVQFSHSGVSNSLRSYELQHARPPCPPPTPRIHPNPHLLSRWCHPGNSSSVVPFSSCPQSLPASESFSKESFRKQYSTLISSF